jgi:predicted component of type VI protein secretion system
MDDHRNVSVSRVYVPNEYRVYLAPVDRSQFDGYEEQLCEELQDYLAEHARRERYVLLSPPIVRLDTDDDLDMGMFGIATRLAPSPEQAVAPPPPAPEVGATAIFKPVRLPTVEAPLPREEPAPRVVSYLTFGEERHELGKHTMTLGRSKDCDLQVLDPNVSRRHAEVRFDDGVYTVVDLGSTNGIEVDGSRVDVLVLDDGTRFTVGSTEVVFTRETR